MDIRPIRTREDHNEMLKRIDALWGAKQGTKEGDELDIICDLVEVYEDRNFPIPNIGPIETLSYYMEINDKGQGDLAALFGSAPRASEVLKKRRSLTVDMIHKLNSEWHIPASSLVRPYHLLT